MNVQCSLQYSISRKKTKPGSINSMKNSSNTNCDKSKSSKQQQHKLLTDDAERYLERSIIIVSLPSSPSSSLFHSLASSSGFLHARRRKVFYFSVNVAIDAEASKNNKNKPQSIHKSSWNFRPLRPVFPHTLLLCLWQRQSKPLIGIFDYQPTRHNEMREERE